MRGDIALGDIYFLPAFTDSVYLRQIAPDRVSQVFTSLSTFLRTFGTELVDELFFDFLRLFARKIKSIVGSPRQSFEIKALCESIACTFGRAFFSWERGDKRDAPMSDPDMIHEQQEKGGLHAWGVSKFAGQYLLRFSVRETGINGSRQDPRYSCGRKSIYEVNMICNANWRIDERLGLFVPFL